MENNFQLGVWLKQMNLSHPLVIAGPCSAETEEQTLSTARALKNTDVNYFRAGVWKPRTRPGGFEGIGEPALKWLGTVKREIGLKTATEVANAAHVELALKHDVDLLWIGARSTVSPFIVQEIADTLQGTDKVVLIKNPVNPDLALWIGALERLQKAGVKKLGVIHRGFSSYQKTKYRNNPEWQLAIDFQKQFPDVPIICDPSHISGKRDIIFDISQTALDLNYDGLMIETHIDPDNAWSDAAQQVTPKKLVEIMNDLKVRKENIEADLFKRELHSLRSKIDVVDQNLLDLLEKRMKIANQIGMLKKNNNVSVLQTTRWTEILENMKAKGLEHDLSEEFTEKFFKAIHQESINHQEKVIRGKSQP